MPRYFASLRVNFCHGNGTRRPVVGRLWYSFRFLLSSLDVLRSLSRCFSSVQSNIVSNLNLRLSPPLLYHEILGNPRLDGKVVRLQREFRSISTTKSTDPRTGAITYSYKMGKVPTVSEWGQCGLSRIGLTEHALAVAVLVL